MDELIEMMEALERGGMRPERAYQIFRKVHGTQKFLPEISRQLWELSVTYAVIIGFKLKGKYLREFLKEIEFGGK